MKLFLVFVLVTSNVIGQTITTYQEIILHTGLSHGFINKGYREGIDPVVHDAYLASS